MLLAYPNDDLGTAAWIDLVSPTDDEIDRVQKATGLRIPGENEISEIESSSRLAFEKGAYRVSTPLVSLRDGGALVLAPVGFVLSSRFLVTVRFAALGRVAAFVMESGIEGAPPVNAARMKAIRADVASLTDYQAHLAGKVQFLLDATLGFINIEQNEIVKTLTIASVVGVPPVLVAGVYGMNFRVMPELTWSFGYPMALGLIVVSALVPLVWFKRRGWM
jgi:Mg2+ and Co2+ transporter CorA